MIFIIDTETTGREPPEVIELASAGIKEGDWSLLSLSCNRYSSKLGSALGALAVHHILDSEVAHYSLFTSTPNLAEATYLIGHNIDYDWKAISSPPVKRICTLAMSRWLRPELDSHSLAALTYFYASDKSAAREQLRTAHGATQDVRLCHQLLLNLLACNNITCTSAEALWQFSETCRVPKTWSFGKFRGQPIRAADRGYMQWCLKQPDMDPYVIAAVREALR